MKRNHLVWCIAILTVVVLLAALKLYQIVWRAKQQGKSSAARLVLGCERSLLTTPVWVAEHQGYFRQSGLNLSIKEFDSGKMSLDAMLAGEELDMCTAAQTPIMFQSFKRDDFAIVAAMVSSESDVKVLGRRDKGVIGVEQLAGKRVGITIGTTAQFFLHIVLIYGGVPASAVEIVDERPSELPHVLSEGRVDAICTWEPHALTARQLLGEQAVTLETRNLYREDFYFVARRDVLAADQEAVKRFLEAIGKAQEFIHEREEEAKAILCRRLGIDPQQIDAVWSEFEFGLKLDQSIFLTLEEEARWAIQAGLTDQRQVPNYLGYIFADALEQVEPEAVQIIK